MEGRLRLLLVVLVPAIAISTIVVILVVPPIFLTLWFLAMGGFISAGIWFAVVVVVGVLYWLLRRAVTGRRKLSEGRLGPR